MAEPVSPEYVQPRQPLNGPITLAESDPAWPEMFAREEDRVRAALGARALLVAHVGSTSVPGLAAKPIIDVVLVVADPAAEQDYVPDLEAAGFVLHLREPEWQQHRLLRGLDPVVNLHVFGEGSAEVERMIVFRDRLRSRPDDCALYEASKRALAARSWTHVQDYADAKSAVVEDILKRASTEGT
jgi:GrpB-like predicted nucleotidyltransferase (UPF0157 family)